MAGSSIIHKTSQQGTIGTHPKPEPQPFLVAPTTADDFNTIGQDLTPVACLSFNDVNFEFDSSFVTPEVATILSGLAPLRERHKNQRGELPPIGVWGHADPVGDEEYNKQLSGRRAKAVYGVLTHDAKLWMELHDQPFHGDDWKAKKMADRMRAAIGDTEKRPVKAVVEDYLKLLLPEPVTKQDFLGRGQDAKGKADFQGCGEFNLLVILAKSEANLPKADRDLANRPDRRVTLFLFKPGVKPNPALWPCPRANEDTAGCRKRFFSDFKQRLAPGELRREHRDPQPGRDEDVASDLDTFACRFYDRVARRSPCERILRAFQLKLFDIEAVALPFAPFVVLDGDNVTAGRADANAILTVPALLVPSQVIVRWSKPKPGDNQGSPDPDPNGEFEFELLGANVDLARDPVDDPIVAQRLHNLSYTAGPTLNDDIAEFQKDYKDRLPANTKPGVLDDATRNLLKDVYNAADPQRKTFSDTD